MSLFTLAGPDTSQTNVMEFAVSHRTNVSARGLTRVARHFAGVGEKMKIVGLDSLESRIVV